jgi:Flp pilus assembly protein TadB
MEQLLIVALALVVGLIVLFFFLGIGRVVSSRDKNETAYKLIEALSDSEIGLERKESGLPDLKTWTGYWHNLALKSGTPLTNNATPGKFALGILLAGAGFGTLVWPQDIFGGIIIAGAGLVFARLYFTSKIKARQILMDKQLPNLLSGIRANLQANLTSQQAIVNQAREIPAPLGDELKILVEEMEVGVTLDKALENFGLRVPSREVQFLVSAFRIAIQSGSDLDPLVATIQEIVVQRNRIANALASAVAKVQPALWVTGIMIPGAFIWSFYSSPENRAFWFSFPFGLIAFIVVAIMYVAGLFIAHKQIEKVKKA